MPKYKTSLAVKRPSGATRKAPVESTAFDQWWDEGTYRTLKQAAKAAWDKQQDEIDILNNLILERSEFD